MSDEWRRRRRRRRLRTRASSNEAPLPSARMRSVRSTHPRSLHFTRQERHPQSHLPSPRLAQNAVATSELCGHSMVIRRGGTTRAMACSRECCATGDGIHSTSPHAVAFSITGKDAALYTVPRGQVSQSVSETLAGVWQEYRLARPLPARRHCPYVPSAREDRRRANHGRASNRTTPLRAEKRVPSVILDLPASSCLRSLRWWWPGAHLLDVIALANALALQSEEQQIVPP